MIKLLVADDSPLARRLFSEIFRAEGDFEIQLARNGAEALALARSFLPDVVMLDVQMPELDGLTCLDRLMIEVPCPVVMVSAMSQNGADVAMEAMALGAVDFIAKPKGALSLHIGSIAPLLVAKVRAAAQAGLRPSLRLRERVRHRISGVVKPAKARRYRSPPLASAIADKDHIDGLGSHEVPGLLLIGASTGGPPAIEALLSELPSDFPWPVLIAQHMPGTFTAAMARRLNRCSALNVAELGAPVALQPGCVYIGRGDADIIVSVRPGGLIAMPAPASPDYPWHPSVDRMVATALEHVPASRLVGVLMTGMGRDGAASMAKLHQLGGQTIAEAESTAVVWGMPGELARLGGASVVAPLQEITAHILRMVN